MVKFMLDLHLQEHHREVSQVTGDLLGNRPARSIVLPYLGVKWIDVVVGFKIPLFVKSCTQDFNSSISHTEGSFKRSSKMYTR